MGPKSGDLTKSESAFETSLRIDPKHMKSYVNLSRVLIEQKRYDDALAKLTKAGEIDPESATVPRLSAPKATPIRRWTPIAWPSRSTRPTRGR
jgi:tetratricopeptide (TPR) repeat protein